MKKLKVFMIAAFILAIGSAFASNQNKASKGDVDYYRLFEKDSEICLETDPCDRGNIICTRFIPSLGASRIIYEEEMCIFFAFDKK